jgi:hypothetical protein
MYGAQARNVAEIEKATRQLGWLFLSRENSSNGGQPVKTFWRNLMSRKRGVSRVFWEINIFIINDLRKQSILAKNVLTWHSGTPKMA